MVGGILTLAGAALQVVSVAAGNAGVDAVGPGPEYTAIVGGAMGGLWLLSGILLWRRSRLGAFLALGSLLPQVAQWIAGRAPPLVEVLYFAAVIALIAVSWRGLESHDPENKPESISNL